MAEALLYDAHKTFDDNYDNGPYNIDETDYRESGTPTHTFLGFPVHTPFGVAAGTLPTSRHTDAAFRLGFDVVCYKTQRSGEFAANAFPNVLSLDITGDLTLERLKQPLVGRDCFPDDISGLSITNSFGVPSRGPTVWVDDLKKAIDGPGNGQLLIMSVMGTIRPGMTQDDYFTDFAQSAAIAKDAGAAAIEINLSCPNVATEGIICYSPSSVLDICTRTKKAIGNTPLIIKIGYYTTDQQDVLAQIVQDVSPYVAAISSINTLQGTIVDEDGNQALPGVGRTKSGVCGASIKWAGLDMVKRLHTLRTEQDYSYEIIGVGGVMKPADYHEYIAAGADCVQSATAPMWNQYLAQEIKQSIATTS